MPSGRIGATQASGPPQAQPTRRPGSGLRSGARARGATTTPAPPAAPAAARTGRAAARTSRQVPPELLEPVATGRQDDVLHSQPPQLRGDPGASLVLDRREPL